MDTNLVNEVSIVAIQVLATIILSLVTLYVPRICKAVEKRIGSNIPEPLLIEAHSLAARAITYAEEWARGQALKQSEKIPGIEKLDKAAEYFNANASAKVSKWLSGKAEDWIVSVLGNERSASD